MDAEESLLHILFLVLFLLISIWVNGIASDTLFRVRSKVECNIFLGHMIDLAVMQVKCAFVEVRMFEFDVDIVLNSTCLGHHLDWPN